MIGYRIPEWNIFYDMYKIGVIAELLTGEETEFD